MAPPTTPGMPLTANRGLAPVAASIRRSAPPSMRRVKAVSEPRPGGTRQNGRSTRHSTVAAMPSGELEQGVEIPPLVAGGPDPPPDQVGHVERALPRVAAPVGGEEDRRPGGGGEWWGWHRPGGDVDGWERGWPPPVGRRWGGVAAPLRAAAAGRRRPGTAERPAPETVGPTRVEYSRRQTGGRRPAPRRWRRESRGGSHEEDGSAARAAAAAPGGAGSRSRSWETATTRRSRRPPARRRRRAVPAGFAIPASGLRSPAWRSPAGSSAARPSGWAARPSSRSSTTPWSRCATPATWRRGTVSSGTRASPRSRGTPTSSGRCGWRCCTCCPCRSRRSRWR